MEEKKDSLINEKSSLENSEATIKVDDSNKETNSKVDVKEQSEDSEYNEKQNKNDRHLNEKNSAPSHEERNRQLKQQNNEDPNNPNGPRQPGIRRKPGKVDFIFGVVLLAIVVGVAILLFFPRSDKMEEFTENQFIEYVGSDKIKSLTIQSDDNEVNDYYLIEGVLDSGTKFKSLVSKERWRFSNAALKNAGTARPSLGRIRGP